MEPRVVVVTRGSFLEAVVSNYGSLGNADYAIASASRIASSDTPGAAIAGASRPTGDTLNYVGGQRMRARSAPSREEQGSVLRQAKTRESSQDVATETVRRAIPDGWRSAGTTRNYLDRFVFEEHDIIAVIGPDGLVANVAKYLEDQVVIGFNPDPDENPGQLVQWTPGDAKHLFEHGAMHHVRERTMVRVTLDNGQSLDCLNEAFIGQVGHQSARYTLQSQGKHERQSSSGLIVTTGTGATGWASSIYDQLDLGYQSEVDRLPQPGETRLVFLVREPWPMSHAFGSRLRLGNVGTDPLIITSEMERGGVVFGDGIEADHLDFPYGRVLTVGVSPKHLHLLEQ